MLFLLAVLVYLPLRSPDTPTYWMLGKVLVRNLLIGYGITSLTTTLDTLGVVVHFLSIKDWCATGDGMDVNRYRCVKAISFATFEAGAVMLLNFEKA